MVLGGPIGIVAGSIALSSGISGTMNAVEQAKDDTTDEFKAGKFIGNVVVNGAIGAATAGVGVAFQGAKVAT
jgi:hypothetical protein